MRSVLAFFFIICLLLPVPCQAQVWVDTHTREDGTIVRGQYRSAPANTGGDDYAGKKNVSQTAAAYKRSAGSTYDDAANRNYLLKDKGRAKRQAYESQRIKK